mmetsp:Transcript_22442/g.40293  ORF Transcript_22442/g.40293 Transcript_22442/m.40293 type:complete len:90 (-) Transcript_22442:41-310(-)
MLMLFLSPPQPPPPAYAAAWDTGISPTFMAFPSLYGSEVGNSAKGLLGCMWYKDHLGTSWLEARDDETVRTLPTPVFGAGQGPTTRAVQ